MYRIVKFVRENPYVLCIVLYYLRGKIRMYCVLHRVSRTEKSVRIESSLTYISCILTKAYSVKNNEKKNGGKKIKLIKGKYIQLVEKYFLNDVLSAFGLFETHKKWMMKKKDLLKKCA